MPRRVRRVCLSILATALIGRPSSITNTSKNDGGLPCFFASAQLLPSHPSNVDYYCGWDWEEANAGCEFPCPSGLDSDCPPLPNGRQRRCIAATGCFVRFRKVYWTGLVSLEFDRAGHLVASGGDDVDDAVAPSGGDGGGAELMTNDATSALETSLRDHLSLALEERKVKVADVTVREQEYDRPCVAAIGDGGDRSSTTSLDMVVNFVAEYIPIDGYLFTDEGLGAEVLTTLGSRGGRPDPDTASADDALLLLLGGIRSSSSFFDALTGISAAELDWLVDPPSSMPSESPTRGSDQAFDIRIDPRPTGSHGIVFNVKTPRDGNTIVITAMSFVTLHEGKLEYVIYSKLGPFEKFVGKDAFWEIVASGQTVGRGAKEYTHVLQDDTTVYSQGETLEYVGFRPLHVPGARGQRSFYVAITKRFARDDGNPIPLLFSYPVDDDADGKRDYGVVDSTPELEVFEGDGVLEHPWPKDGDGPYYRRPRGFIGSFEYDRYPCYPALNFTGWPCPYQRRTKDPTGRPTGRPTGTPTNPRATTGRPSTRTTTAVDDAPTGAPTEDAVSQTVPMETDVQKVGENGPEEVMQNDDSTLAVSVGIEEEEEEEDTSNGSFVLRSWKISFRSSGGGLAILLLLS